MVWWHTISEHMRDSKMHDINGPRRFVSWRVHLKTALLQEAVDIVFFLLGLFTYFYIITLALLYFGKLWNTWYIISFFVDAFAEPYLGAVGVYVILKELRKRRRHHPSRHKGEFFVFFWTVLFVLAIFSATIFEEYTLNNALKLIVTNTVAIWLIYFAGVIHKP